MGRSDCTARESTTREQAPPHQRLVLPTQQKLLPTCALRSVASGRSLIQSKPSVLSTRVWKSSCQA